MLNKISDIKVNHWQEVADAIDGIGVNATANNVSGSISGASIANGFIIRIPTTTGVSKP